MLQNSRVDQQVSEFTIEQALQRAVEAHKAGKLQEAEALYRAVLQTQPNHPDANHNLGVMAISLNQAEAALPLFKIALEANPNQGQFWLSYIDALIKEKQFDNARGVLEQGKKLGLAGEKIDVLEARLTAILMTPSIWSGRSGNVTILKWLIPSTHSALKVKKPPHSKSLMSWAMRRTFTFCR